MLNCSACLLLSVLLLVDRFELGFVSQRHVSFDHSVIEVVFHLGVEVAEHPAQIYDAAYSEPDSRYRRHKCGNGEENYDEIDSPVFDFPRSNHVPDGDQQKCESEAVDERVDKVAPGDDFVARCVLGSDSDELVVEVLFCPRTLYFARSVEAVFAAVQHTVEVERLFAGEI